MTANLFFNLHFFVIYYEIQWNTFIKLCTINCFLSIKMSVITSRGKFTIISLHITQIMLCAS